MLQSALPDQNDYVDAPDLGRAPLNEEDLMGLPLAKALRLAAVAFERRYLLAVMERAAGSVSEGARLAGSDRSNFRRKLQRHGLR